MLIDRPSSGVEIERQDVMPGRYQSGCHGFEIPLAIQGKRRTFEGFIVGRQVEFGRMHCAPTRSQGSKAIFDEAKTMFQRSKMLQRTG